MIVVSGEWAPRCRVQPSRVCVCVCICTASLTAATGLKHVSTALCQRERERGGDVGPQVNHAAGRGKQCGGILKRKGKKKTCKWLASCESGSALVLSFQQQD